MKKNLSIMIIDNLRKFGYYLTIDYSTNMSIGQAAGKPVPRTYYTNFDNAITEKYHVVLEGWPLERFCSPSDIQSRTEISVLMKSLESGATRFRKLSSTEFEQWSEKCFNSKVDSTTAQGPTNTSSPDSPPPPASLPASSPSISQTNTPPASLPAPSPLASQESVFNDGAGTSTTSDPDNENIPPSPSRDPGSENVQQLSSMTVPAKRKHSGPQRPLTNAFVNAGVTSTNEATVMVVAKVRKPRADKGKKRGPRAK
jgi:hypothetical protein